MPCSDYQDRNLPRPEGVEAIVIEASKLKTRLNLLTRLLCEACETLSEENISVSQELKDWYDIHLVLDKKHNTKKEG